MKNKKIFSTIYLIFSIIFTILLYYKLNLLESCDWNKWLVNFSIIILITLILNLLLFRLSNIKILSIEGFFLILSYLFHFAQMFLLLLDYDFGELEWSIAVKKYGYYQFMQASKISVIFINCVFIGILIGRLITKENSDYKGKDKVESKTFIFYFGVILTIIGLSAQGYIFINQLIARVGVSYTGVHEIDVNQFIYSMSLQLLPGVFLLMVSQKGKSKRMKVILVSYVMFSIVFMITGLRAYNLINIVIVVFLYTKVSNIKINFKRIIIFLVLGRILLELLLVIRNTRMDAFGLKMIFSEMFSTKNSVVLSMLAEFGITINIVSLVVENSYNFSYGNQLITSILSVIPFTSYIFSNVDFSTMTIVGALNSFNLGGSYVADFYFDFRMIGIVAAIAYGIFIYKLSHSVENGIKKNQFYKVACLLPLVVEILFSVRSTISKIPRTFVWFILLYLFISILTKVLIKFRKVGV